jgi:transcriptional regulator with XRE-family HTH domain
MHELHLHWGRDIRAARKAAGLSRTELASMVGVAEITIARWETGFSGPRDARRVALAEVLGVPVGTLFSYVAAGRRAASTSTNPPGPTSPI